MNGIESGGVESDVEVFAVMIWFQAAVLEHPASFLVWAE